MSNYEPEVRTALYLKPGENIDLYAHVYFDPDLKILQYRDVEPHPWDDGFTLGEYEEWRREKYGTN